MRAVRYDDPLDFLAAIEPWLLQDEAMNNIIFGVVSDAAAGRYEGNNYFGVAFEDERVAGAVWRTPPWPMGVAFRTEPQALVMHLDELWGAYDDDFQMMCTPGAAQVASRHRAIDGRTPITRLTGQGIYQASSVRPPQGIDGQLRLASRRDRDIVSEWGLGFQREALANRGEQLRNAQWNAGLRMIEARELYLWEVEGRPVSMAAARGPTPHGIRLSYVYTPVPLRRRGYASALTAAVTQQQFDHGRKFCFLFTDLDNPTSNHIYQQVGYEYLGEMNIYGTS